MPWIPSYPDAQARADAYATVIQTLNVNRNNIETELRASRTLQPTNFEAANLHGDAYADYLTRRDHWFERKEGMDRIFDAFVTDLQGCINQASTQEDLWRSRIGIGVWVDD